MRVRLNNHLYLFVKPRPKKNCTCYAQDLRKLAVAPSAMVCKYVDINDNTIKEYSVKDTKIRHVVQRVLFWPNKYIQ